MKKIRLPLDTKSLFFNIKNDNFSGHTATVATPIRKTFGNFKLSDIFLLKDNEINISCNSDLISLLVKHSKTKVLIKNVFVFDKLSVNGKIINPGYSFGCYIKEETDASKVQFGRLKLHYPSKFIFEDEILNINNKKVFEAISKALNDYAFLIQSFDFDFDTGVLNFNALIVGENNVPYSKVFIINKGVGNKLNNIFNEVADDYDREIIALKKHYGEEINPSNYIEYFKKLKTDSLDIIAKEINGVVDDISSQYPYSLFDFCYWENNVLKYGIIRITATKNKYFNLSINQQNFMRNFSNDVNIFLISNILEKPILSIINSDDLKNFNMVINSIKYEEN